ncbi:inorganic diphosphatase [Mucilaginibacter sp. SMC90]|uniref:inorganic diphosphatase n=1 Tax=Mucilaginibacter sp. SMC90 TaxID=2929803 RepID=UPI001FB445E6|nr:inorganic diphosphatase [Mucilaginibacter sp. SMC90]UOE52884.1 inorganic diphosphatase [Mucilaginibacter sp. SMC90]
MFPFDFGMIPGTKGEDGDPLDIIVLAEHGTFPGCLIDCRIIGAFQCEQTERDGQKICNDRLVGFPDVSQLFPDVKELSDLPESILNQLEHFFKNYNEQADKVFEVTARLKAAPPLKLIAMELFLKLFGEGEHLDNLQMSCRGAAMFLIMLVLIRISGRRSFGVRTALDNIIAVSLGAIMSRAVVGASPFVPVVCRCFVIVLLHRGTGRLIAGNKKFSRVIEGQEILLFEDGVFIKAHMKRALVCEEDVMQGGRETALTEDMNQIQKVYIERNGEISVVKK